MVTLFAYLVRRADLSHDEFLDYWRNQHGPLIRDTPALVKYLVRYEQHARLPGRRGGAEEFDGVAVQVYRSWDDFMAMLNEPEAQLMTNDENNFLDRDKLVVLFAEDSVTVVGG